MITEGIKYAGSKLKLIPHILEEVNKLNNIKNVLDGFSGTTRVSQALAQNGLSVTANDISAWSEVFATCYLKTNESNAFFQEILDHLNNLTGYEGWFTEHYGSHHPVGDKRPFQAKNTKKLDAIRDEIENLNLAFENKCLILTSLILALEKVDSTLGHYVSYLAKWSTRSHGDIHLQLPKRFPTDTTKHRVSRDDIFDAVKRDYDLVYLDPPYGSNNEKMPASRVRYASYYHLWKTIINHDKPEVFGKANRRVDSRDTASSSIFEEFRKDSNNEYIATDAMRKMINSLTAKYAILSYSSGGRVAKDDILSMIEDKGQLLNFRKIDFTKNVMSSMSWTNDWTPTNSAHKEYLFIFKP